MFTDVIRMAKQTSQEEILVQLADHQSSNVRRMVAKNIHTPKTIIHRLIDDPVMNVSYLAVNNPNNQEIKKDFGEDADHPCVICAKDDIVFNCTTCIPLREYRTIS